MDLKPIQSYDNEVDIIDDQDTVQRVTGAQISEDEKKFIWFMSSYLIVKHPLFFTTTVDRIDKSIKNLPEGVDVHKYRMKFESMDQCLK